MSSGLRFTKMHGAGNDFVLVEDDGREWSELAPALCRRHFGVGADGLLVAVPSSVADLRMRMFNPDGTEDECGNGVRCLALFAVARGLVSGSEFRLETLSGVKRILVSREGERAAWVTAEWGRARLEPAAIPARVEGEDALGLSIPVDGEAVEASALSTGSAHTVLFETPDDERFRRLSPLLERHPLFPERTSVLWTERLSDHELRLRIWERAVGETLACGTGAAAAAVAAHLTGRTGRKVSVTSPGGTLQVEIGEGLSVTLSGPAAFVYEGVWPCGPMGE